MNGYTTSQELPSTYLEAYIDTQEIEQEVGNACCDILRFSNVH